MASRLPVDDTRDVNGLHIVANWADWMRAAGLDSWDALWRWSDGVVMRQFGTRRTVRLERAGRVLYLKRHDCVSESDGWWTELGRWLRWQPRRSDARREWDNLHALSAAGLPVPEAVALGECPNRSGASLLLTAAVPNAEPADAVLRQVEFPLVARRELLMQIARLARRLHDAGFWHQDLYLCHVFVGPPVFSTGPQPPEAPSRSLTLIDLQRVGHSARGAPWDRRVKDLAQLVYSLRPDWASRTDGLRLLSAYCQPSAGDLGPGTSDEKQPARELYRPAPYDAQDGTGVRNSVAEQETFAGQQKRLAAAVWRKAAQIARRDRKRLRAAAAAGQTRAADELRIREHSAQVHGHRP